MLISEIRKKVLAGELILEKTYQGKRTRRKYIWNKQGEIEKVEMITYDAYMCRAMENSHSGYRISKKVFNQLLVELANKKLSTV